MLLPLPLAVLLVAAATGAQDGDVAEGLSLYQRLKYDRAIVVLDRALTKRELSKDDRRAALETLGFAYTVLGDGAHAELTFHALLDLVPSHEVASSLSPRLRSSFAQAKSSWLEGRHVRFALTSPDGARTLTGALQDGDPRRVGRVVTREASGLEVELVCEVRDCRGERPKATFWVDVRDPAGGLLHTAGPFAPAEPEGLPWWGWAAIGVGVVGSAIAIGVAAGSSSEPPEGTLGRLQLP